METENLKLFLHLSETLHFGRTSRECFVSPPTLTRVIQRLEESCGKPLFVRDRRMVELTPAGIEFQQFARETLRSWELLRGNLSAGDGVLRGELKLFCSVTASYTILPEVLPSFRERYPGVLVQLTTGDVAEAVERARDGRADVVISALLDQPGEAMVAQEFVRTPLVAIMPQMGFDVERVLLERCEAKAWNRVPMIFPSGGLLRQRIDTWLASLGVSRQAQETVSGHEAILSMVNLGLGVGIIPKLVLDRSLFQTSVHVLDLAQPLPDFPVGFYTAKSRLKSQVVRAFWDVVEMARRR